LLQGILDGSWGFSGDGSVGDLEPMLAMLRTTSPSQPVPGAPVTVSGSPDPTPCADSRCQGRPCSGTAPQDCTYAQPIHSDLQ
jgi:hypothetical protein